MEQRSTKQQWIDLLHKVGPSDEIRDLLATTALRDPIVAKELNNMYERKNQPLVSRRPKQTPSSSMQTQASASKQKLPPTANSDIPNQVIQKQAAPQPNTHLVRSIVLPTQNMKDGGEQFVDEIEALEALLGFTGAYNQLSADDQHARAEEAWQGLRSLARKMWLVIKKRETDWPTKENAISVLLHAMMAVSYAPTSEFTDFIHNHCDSLGMVLKGAFEKFSVDETAKFCADQQFILKFVNVAIGARWYGLEAKMRLDVVSGILEAVAGHPDHATKIGKLPWESQTPWKQPIARLSVAPWYPVVPNKLIVSRVTNPPTDFSDVNVKRLPPFRLAHHTADIEDAFGYKTGMVNRTGYKKLVKYGDNAEQIIDAIKYISKSALEEATKPDANWATVVHATHAFIDLCWVIAVDEKLWSKQPKIWTEVRLKLTETPICPDQYLMRLVEYLLPMQRFELSWSQWDGADDDTMLGGLGLLMERTRKLHTMAALETVRNWLIEARDLMHDA